MSTTIEDWIDYESGWSIDATLADELERKMSDLQDLLATILYDYEEAVEEGLETPSGYPYDGCTTCDTRETLVYLLPIIAEACEAGRIKRIVTEAQVISLFGNDDAEA